MFKGEDITYLLYEDDVFREVFTNLDAVEEYVPHDRDGVISVYEADKVNQTSDRML